MDKLLQTHRSSLSLTYKPTLAKYHIRSDPILSYPITLSYCPILLPHPIAYPIILYHIITYIMSCHVMSCRHVMSYITSYHITSHRNVLYRIVSYHIISYIIFHRPITLLHTYDVTMMYLIALNTTVAEEGDPRNGSQLFKNSIYLQFDGIATKHIIMYNSILNNLKFSRNVYIYIYICVLDCSTSLAECSQ